MKITVVGASGLIGTKVVESLRSDGNDVVASSRSSGVDVVTGDGLADALARAAVATPRNGIVNVGGPQKITFDQMARDALARKGDDTKTVIVESAARYYGAALATRSLVTRD